MTDEDFYTRANRPSRVTESRIRKLTKGDNFYPPESSLKMLGFEQCDVIWEIMVNSKTGFDRDGISLMYVETLADAESLKEASENASAYDKASTLPKRFKEIYNEHNSFEHLFASPLEDDMWKELEILEAAGIHTRTSPSEKALKWLGAEHVSWMKEEFGENWSVVGVMEYCANKLPASSLAYLAAQSQFNYYITQDDMSYGYIHREILLIMGGAENAAFEYQGLKEKRAAMSGESASKARLLRLENFMSEIERLGHHYPDIDEKYLVEKAFKNAHQKFEKFWKPGYGQAEKYATDLRSVEPFKSRYFAVFHNKA